MSKGKISALPNRNDKVYDFFETLLMGLLVSWLTASIFAMLSHLFQSRITMYEILSYPTTIVGTIGAFIGAYVYKKRETPKRSRSFYMAIASLLASVIASVITLLIVLYLIRYTFPANI
jgi:uncharacterized membrane protein YeaQ/YmgE (transglycosylase-associated protein family)